MGKNILAGVYRCEITPPAGTGEVHEGKSNLLEYKVESPMYANVLVLDDGKKQAVIISTDICVIPVNIALEIISEISQLTGIPKEGISLHATHTHAFQWLDKNKQDLYTQYYCRQVVTAVIQALQRKQLVSAVYAGRGENKELVFNRRLKRPDGRILMNFMYDENADSCDFSGITDPELLAICFEDVHKRLISIIWNFGNHNNILSGVISPDQSGHVNRKLIKAYGEQLVPIFLIGACGNENWIDASKHDAKNDDSYQKLERFSDSIFKTIQNVIGKMESINVDDIDYISETLMLTRREKNDYDLCEDGTFGSQMTTKEFFAIDKTEDNPITREGGEFEFRVNALRIGSDIAITANPSEYFCDFALEIKRNSPFKFTLVCELANGWAGYLPTEYAWEEGGYEPRASWFIKGTGERVTEIHKMQLAKLKENV
ncbi:MAG: hypothetical protein N2489_11420 [Clostridia bacterium]|nr:hypothetical protein [Clostridia bacterium]